MADNKDESFSGSLPDNGSENPPEKIASAEIDESKKQNQETENMEVHKHPHHVTHKKKWAEYLLEFFMLLEILVFMSVPTSRLPEIERQCQAICEKHCNSINKSVRFSAAP